MIGAVHRRPDFNLRPNMDMEKSKATISLFLILAGANKGRTTPQSVGESPDLKFAAEADLIQNSCLLLSASTDHAFTI